MQHTLLHLKHHCNDRHSSKDAHGKLLHMLETCCVSFFLVAVGRSNSTLQWPIRCIKVQAMPFGSLRCFPVKYALLANSCVSPSKAAATCIQQCLNCWCAVLRPKCKVSAACCCVEALNINVVLHCKGDAPKGGSVSRGHFFQLPALSHGKVTGFSHKVWSHSPTTIQVVLPVANMP